MDLFKQWDSSSDRKWRENNTLSTLKSLSGVLRVPEAVLHSRCLRKGGRAPGWKKRDKLCIDSFFPAVIPKRKGLLDDRKKGSLSYVE